MSTDKQKKRAPALRCGRLVRSGPELSQERIAKISNDISECIYDTHTKSELRQCVKYYQQKAREAETNTHDIINSMLQFIFEKLEARRRGARPNKKDDTDAHST